MAEQSDLEKIAIETRNAILTNNKFDNFDSNNHYSSTHTRAKSDEQTPIHGKGTGLFLDVENGGGSVDINGIAHIAGSGRIGNVGRNEFNKSTPYEKPDTSGNIGQVQI